MKRFHIFKVAAGLTVLLLHGIVWAAGADDVDNCASCHRVLLPKRLAGPVDECRGGLHEIRGVSCNGCHGGDPTEPERAAAKSQRTGYFGVPQGAAGVASLCGRCHKTAYKTWLESGHNPSASCVSCHGAHGIEKASLDLISPAKCSGCHPFPKANPLKTHILESRTAVLSVRAKADRLAGEKMDMEKTPAGLAALDERIVGMYHMTYGAAIKATADGIKRDAAKLGKELKDKEERWRLRRKVFWAAAAIFGLSVLSAAYIAIHRIKTRRMLGR